ncbi:hypothetical protein F4820DRAFT_449104 [Hypoxylon rubiginosum]|uniref:Uncharacterized protein n=1 Tax=Hypoxylon rubiginosum TaxID=110542 RepID=A0ACB9YY80_9PEZI|nr:hypothetical protein F4820DRAFT_449104 [Hypoxylon rubiginosum]
MKTSILAYLLVFHWQLNGVTATLGNESTPSTTTTTDSLDCNEFINQVLKGIGSYPAFASQVVAVGKKVGLPSATAWSVCKTFSPKAINCDYAALSVANSISLAIIHGFIDLNPPKEGATTATKDHSQQRRELLESHVGDYLRSRGVEFEDISIAPLMKRRQDYGHFMEFIRALTVPSGGIRAVPFTTGTDRLERRTGGPGFKTVWQVHSRTGSPPAPVASQLADILENDWKSRVESDHSIGDYIGAVNFDKIGYIQLRIIPETGGFGDNFETTEKCSA